MEITEEKEYIVKKIIKFCSLKSKNSEFKYTTQVCGENTDFISINLCVSSHPYHDDVLPILEIDYKNNVIKLQRAHGILFKEPLNAIGEEKHLDIIDSWTDNAGYMSFPFDMINKLFSAETKLKQTFIKIIKNTLGYGYGQQIVEKIKLFIKPEYEKSSDLVLNLNSGSIHSAMITVENTPWRNGIIKGDLLFAKIKADGKSKYINFKSSLAYLFEQMNIEYSANSTEQKSDLIRIDLDVFMSQLNNPTKDFQKIMDMAFLGAISFNEFGCCSKYAECEKTGKCQHTDQLYATACQYQKLMKRTGKFENS